MKSDFKKMFFSSLMTVLFIISNLLNLKYTTFGEIIVPVSFVAYPFIMLCILIILDKYGKKEVYNIIISTVFIQIFILLSYSIATKMNNQMIIPDLANAVNNVFAVDEVMVLSSLIAFMFSSYVIVYLFNIFKRYSKKILGVIIGTLSAITMYGFINIIITNYNVGKEIFANLILSHLSISVLMTIIITILFYILKESDAIYTEDDREKVVVNLEEEKEFMDKTIIEVINSKEKKEVSKLEENKSNANTRKKKSNKKSSPKTTKKPSERKDKTSPKKKSK